MTIPTWPTSFLADTASTYARVDRARAVEVAVAEILHPSLEFDFDRARGDPLSVFATMLSALPRDGRAPLVAATLGEALEGVLGIATMGASAGAGGQEGRVGETGRMIKALVLVYGEVRREEAGEVLRGCLERLDGLSGAGAGRAGGAGGVDGRHERRVKRRRRSSGKGVASAAGMGQGMGQSMVSDLARGVARALRADDEIRAQWPDLAL